jgi:hypothetical protein
MDIKQILAQLQRRGVYRVAALCTPGELDDAKAAINNVVTLGYPLHLVTAATQ